MSRLKNVLLIACIAFALFAAGCTSAPAPTPTPTPTPPATPTPLATAPDNIVVTLPLGTASPIVQITHYINGTITYNKQPTALYHVLVDTDKGNEYGNVTDANGNFTVKFADDGSTTYWIKLADSDNNLIYQDSLPRYLNHTGPLSINIEVPGVNRINVSIS